jgi:hypothetical protein
MTEMLKSVIAAIGIDIGKNSVCERMRRDGGSVFPAFTNTGDPNGPLRPVR